MGMAGLYDSILDYFPGKQFDERDVIETLYKGTGAKYITIERLK